MKSITRCFHTQEQPYPSVAWRGVAVRPRDNLVLGTVPDPPTQRVEAFYLCSFRYKSAVLQLFELMPTQYLFQTDKMYISKCVKFNASYYGEVAKHVF